MRLIVAIAIALAAAMPALAQVVELSGVINRYVAVTRVDSCEQRIGVESTSGFAPGDRVLLVQMKGGTIDQDTSGVSFGRVLEMGTAGVYHFGTVERVGATTIDLLESVSRGFDVTGFVQLVRVPRYRNARVVDTLRPMRWNGRLGGVVALEVTDTLWLDAPVDATGAGFRGGRMVVQNREDCSIDLRVQHISSSLSGGRGETYAYYDTITAHGGRGYAGGAGGGGNSSNTGGGGGAGYGQGGNGGGQFTACGPQVVSGEGGQMLATTELADRIFLGSGGGAGHANNGQGTSGASGGGIAIVRAIHLFGNDHAIAGDGSSVEEPAGIDGAGGGGGGGTVILEYDTLHTPVNLAARGGDGGSGTGPNGCHGPGGGGGGGIIQVATERFPGLVGIVVDGGRPGLYTADNIPDCVDSPHNAIEGAAGLTIGDIVVIEGHAGGVFSVAGVGGLPGDSVDIVLTYRGSLDSAFRPIRGVTTTIEFDSTLISVDHVIDAIRPGALQMYRRLTVDESTLAKYRGMLLLGPSGTGSLHIRSVRPDLAVTPMHCQWKALTVDGTVSIELCEEGSTRAVRVGSAVTLRILSSNPSRGQVVVGFTLAEDGPVALSLVDARGAVLRRVDIGATSPGEHSTVIDLADIAPGRYVLELVTRSESVTSILVLQP